MPADTCDLAEYPARQPGAWLWLRRAILCSLLPLHSFACASPRPVVAARPLHVDASLAGVNQERPEASPYFVSGGRPFCFSGANNYFLPHVPPAAAREVLEGAAAMKLRVIRTWAFLDRGSLDGSVKNVHEPGHKSGVFFQSWDPSLGRAVAHEGPEGLQRIDFVLHHARRLDLKVILVLTNSWRDFGGMDQYLAWYGITQHHQFYTDERVKRAYKDWASTLINRRNSLDGTLYLEDPAIFAWELANEPRTSVVEKNGSSQGWDLSTIPRWADEMSAFIKSIDPNHMVSVGDEGFLLREEKSGWPYRAPFGVDHEALTRLPNVDFGTYHLYPQIWDADENFGLQWIRDHVELGRRLGKPAVLEEYGIRVERAPPRLGPVVAGEARRAIYDQWHNELLTGGTAGALFWMLSVHKERQPAFPDYDGFALYQGDDMAPLFSNFAQRMSFEAVACATEDVPSSVGLSPFVRALPGPTVDPLAKAR